MTVGEVIAAFGEHIYSYWPVRIVNEWEQGVRTRNGHIQPVLKHDNGLFGSGLHFFWPVIGEIQTETCNIEIGITDPQLATTLDGVCVVFSLTSRYRIVDLAAMFRHIHDQEDTIQNAQEAVAGRWVPELEWPTLDEQLPLQVEAELTPKLEEWGVELEELAIHSLAKTRAFRIFHD